MNLHFWIALGIALLFTAVPLIWLGRQLPPNGLERPFLEQAGWLSAFLGVFMLIAQFVAMATVFAQLIITLGILYLLNRFVFAPRRCKHEAIPVLLQIGREFFPVLFVIFLARSFIAEPYFIPSSSMRPGLIVGDFILVNKFAYGLRTPILNSVFLPVGSPQRGDVLPFEYPHDRSHTFIKRVVGLPGDVVDYHDKQLRINGKLMKSSQLGIHEYLEDKVTVQTSLLTQRIGSHDFLILWNPAAPVLAPDEVFPGQKKTCHYEKTGFTCKVPDGHYFMLGDNRDNSADSRYWGFVPEDHIIGKAERIIVNFKQLSRIGMRADDF